MTTSYRYRSEDRAYYLTLTFVKREDVVLCYVLIERKGQHAQPFGNFKLKDVTYAKLLRGDPAAKAAVLEQLNEFANWSTWIKLKDQDQVTKVA